MPTVFDALIVPLAGVNVGAAGGLAADAMPTGMQAKMSNNDSRTTRIFPLSLYLKISSSPFQPYLNCN
jgi:hypothetical protein